jgi:transposase
MSFHPQAIPPIPEETARVAHAVLPKGNMFIQMRDEFGTFFRDEDFLDLFSERGQPAESAWRLALMMVMQYAEGLTDAGFDFSILSEFRSRLLNNQAERRLFDVMLAQFRERGWAKERGKQRTDSTHVLAAIRSVNRLECVGETMY